jgi:hypothetical protein
MTRSAEPNSSALAGRDRELSRLVQALDDAERGNGSSIVLEGEPGIGKTRLAEEISELARQRGARVAWGAAWDGGGAPPHWPWIEVLRALKSALPEPSPSLRRDLGPLWGEDTRDSDENPDAQQFRRCDALRAVLATAASQSPLLIVLDDLHAADQGTLSALLFVARALRSLPILVVGTRRGNEAPLRPDANALLARVARESSVLSLARLDPSAVSAMMQSLEPLHPKLVARVQEMSCGNPLFVREILRMVRTGAPPDRIPEGIRCLLAERLEQLEPDTKGLLEMAAVLGRETTLGTLSALSGMPRTELEHRLRVPCSTGIVELSERDGLVFRHPLFRQSLYEGLEPAQRALLHAKAADVLDRSQRSAMAGEEAIARHLLRALPLVEPKRAVERARAAARLCRRDLAFDRAVELLERAQLAAESESSGTRVDLDIELAEALVLVGQCERSRALCVEAAEHAERAGDARRYGRAALAYGSEIRPGVNDPLQIRLLERALAGFTEDDASLRAQVMARLAATRPSATREEPVALAHAAIDLARATGDGHTLLQTLYLGGAALICYASPQERLCVSREFSELALDLREYVFAQRGYQRWAVDASDLGDREEMERAMRDEARLGRMLGHAWFRWKSALLRSGRALLEGRWADSEAAITEAAALLREADEPLENDVLGIHRMGALRSRYKAPPSSNGGASERVSLPSDDFMQPLIAASASARSGDMTGARASLERLRPIPEPAFRLPAAVSVIAELAYRFEDRSLAEQVMPAVREVPSPAVSWGAFGFVWDSFVSDLLGGLELVLGNVEPAIQQLERAVDAADRFGARPAAVESRIKLAKALFSRADPPLARILSLCAEARAEAHELDMTGSLLRIEELDARLRPALPAIHEAPRRASETGSFELTREGEIWIVTFGGRSMRLKHSRAVELLKQLADHPGREFHVLDFGAVADGTIDAGDAGERLDSKATEAYKQRRLELQRELEQAEQWNDAARRERLRAELEFLEDELGRGLGAFGRTRRASSAAERARVNVHKRLRGVIERIGSDLPELANYLKASVKTGLFVSYTPTSDSSHGA